MLEWKIVDTESLHKIIPPNWVALGGGSLYGASRNAGGMFLCRILKILIFYNLISFVFQHTHILNLNTIKLLILLRKRQTNMSPQCGAHSSLRPHLYQSMLRAHNTLPGLEIPRTLRI